MSLHLLIFWLLLVAVAVVVLMVAVGVLEVISLLLLQLVAMERLLLH
jgi:hypothetical protein